MKIYYDFHIHSVLSPCGDADSTPNNIVNMSKLNGLNAIALSDHNSVKNCPATIKVGLREGLVVLPAMELTTAEDVHVLCLFERLEDAQRFESRVDETRLVIQNRAEIFGEQLILNDVDEPIGKYQNLLIVSSGIAINEVNSLVESFGGIAVPAHIDKQSNGIVGILGEFDYSLGFRGIESKTESLVKLPRLVNSDAHYVWDISEAENYIETDEAESNERLTAAIVFAALKKYLNFR